MLVNEWIDKDSMEKISIEQISTDYLSFETTRIYVTFNIDAVFILPENSNKFFDRSMCWILFLSH